MAGRRYLILDVVAGSLLQGDPLAISYSELPFASHLPIGTAFALANAHSLPDGKRLGCDEFLVEWRSAAQALADKEFNIMLDTRVSAEPLTYYFNQPEDLTGRNILMC